MSHTEQCYCMVCGQLQTCDVVRYYDCWKWFCVWCGTECDIEYIDHDEYDDYASMP